MEFEQTLLIDWQHAALLGTSFGLLHAFDADHLATIGGLMANDRSASPTAYALRWATGHAVALGLIAVFVLGLNVTGVLEWTAYAELLVGAALLLIGCQAWFCVAQRLGVTANPPPPSTEDPTSAAHVHFAARPHLHFFAPFHSHRKSGRAGLAMGLLHGGAGSAAVLALLPLAHLRSAIESAAYLMCFSLGVAAGALAFSTVFGLLSRRTEVTGEKIGAAFQAAVGTLAICSGVWLLLEIVYGGG
jgi:hypothetical protein